MRTERVTTLKGQATELLSEIERDKQPILIIQHGMPTARLAGVEIHQLMQLRTNMLEGIARGEQAIAEGRVAASEEAPRAIDEFVAALRRFVAGSVNRADLPGLGR